MPEGAGGAPSAGDIAVVGLPASGAPLGPAAADAVARAALLVGGRRALDLVGPANPTAARVVVEDGLPAALDAVGAAGDERVCVLASGDPGFFGIGRALAERFGASRLAVHPAPSAVSLAFARLGLPWDDAVVVSAHGRPLSAAASAAARAPKAAVLTSPDSPPQALGALLQSSGAGGRTVAVCSRLGTDDESVALTDVDGLAAGTWEPLSVVVVLDGDGAAVTDRPTLAWGLPVAAFAHRAGMITKAEVRAVILGKLALPTRGVLWDVGAGSGSVAVECARVAPGLRVVAVDRDPAAVALVGENASAHGVTVEAVCGAAPEILETLPAPDRAFVGGGGLAVLDGVLARLRPGGTVVAALASLDRAASAFERLGELVEVSVNRGCRLPEGGVRLQAENPVFVAWGPPPEVTA